MSGAVEKATKRRPEFPAAEAVRAGAAAHFRESLLARMPISQRPRSARRQCAAQPSGASPAEDLAGSSGEADGSAGATPSEGIAGSFVNADGSPVGFATGDVAGSRGMADGSSGACPSEGVAGSVGKADGSTGAW